jgi:predicted alpha/beta hydrolase family esterase
MTLKINCPIIFVAHSLGGLVCEDVRTVLVVIEVPAILC